MSTSTASAVSPSRVSLQSQNHFPPPPPCSNGRISLFGVEHLTMDVNGDVRWRGVVVEQFQPPSWDEPRWKRWMRVQSIHLEVVCREIEEFGIRPTLETVCAW